MKHPRIYTSLLLCFLFFFGFLSVASAQIISDTLSASKDAIVRSQNPTTNYGSNTTTEAYSYSSCAPFDCPQYVRGLLDFNFSSIPRNAIILEASLKLYGISHLYATSNASYIYRNTASWVENSVTWNNKPAYSSGTSSIDRLSLAQSSSSTQDYSVDIKSMVNYWIKRGSTNQFGITLKLQTESLTRRMSFGSKENSNSAKRPKLIIKYVLPVKVEVEEVVHVDIFDPYSGFASIAASGGAGPYTYSWSNGKTGTSSDSLTAGLYWVKATDSLGNKGGAYVVIGKEADTVQITMQPDSVLGYDALISSFSPTLICESGINDEFRAHYGTSGGTPFQHRSLLWFDINTLPLDAEIINAQLTLYGKDHQSTTQSNASYLARITSNWLEDSVWWNNAPTFTTTDSIYLAQSSSATQNYSVDVTNHVQYFIENPQYNFGFLLRLIVQTYHARLVFHSSGASNSSLRPKLVFSVKLPLINRVSWANLVNTEAVDEYTVEKTSGEDTTYDAGATSTHLLPEGDDGWFEYTVSQLSDKKMIGFSVFPNLDESDTTINYAFELLANDTILISEMGARNATGRKVLLDDKLKIERIADSLYYKINDVIVARRSINPQEILILDVSLYSSAAKFGKVKISEKFKNILLIFPNLAYAIPKKELNAGIRYCGIITQYELKFKFINKYDNVGENLQYKIYNHLGNITNLPTLQLEEGINLYSINLQSLSLTNGAYYILEITDSKSEKSYLKFKYN